MQQQEAVNFVEDVLKLSSPLSKLRENRALFLNEIIKAFLSIPFQNIHLLCEAEADRHVPTWEESKESVMGGFGGLCYSQCLFMKCLLEALGYDVYFAACDAFGFPDNHITTIVRDLSSPGSHHIVDNSAFPTFEAISLDFEVESPIYFHSYLEYKFMKRGSQILRLHRKGEHTPIIPGGECIIDGWRRIFEFELMPRDLSYFEKSMNVVYTKPGENSPFLETFHAVVYKDLKLIAIKNDLLMLENDGQKLVVTKMQTHEEMITTVKKYFPMFTVKEITKAMEVIQLPWNVNDNNAHVAIYKATLSQCDAVTMANSFT